MDQAQQLRNVIKQRNQNNINAAKVITITSGKGGVGKSNLAVNLAVCLRKAGKRVVIFDADFGLANVEVVFGAIPKYTLFDFIYRGKSISEVITKGPMDVGFISGGSGIIGLNDLTHEQVIEAYKICKAEGVEHFGLHTMVASNELNPDYFVETARLIFELAVEIKEKCGVRIEFVDLGGGVGIPYKPGQKKVDLEYVATESKKIYDEVIVPAGLDPLEIYYECGRPITGPYGWLVTKAIHEKHIYREYIGVDATMADLMRPGMYGAYHEVTVVGKENAPKDHVYDVTGSLCENCDKFAV